MCVEYIEREGLDAEGLYRVPGNRAHVDLLFAKFDDDKVRPGPHLDKYKRTSVRRKTIRPVLESMNILWCVLIFLNLTCPLTSNPGTPEYRDLTFCVRISALISSYHELILVS